MKAKAGEFFMWKVIHKLFSQCKLYYLSGHSGDMAIMP